jgi:hypothetical protein
MPHASPTSTAPTDPAALLPAPPAPAKSRGNPNLALAPAQPARGRGPRGARTIRGNYGANARADNRHRLTLLRMSRVDIALDRYQALLPPAPSPIRPPQGARRPVQPRRSNHSVLIP